MWAKLLNKLLLWNTPPFPYLAVDDIISLIPVQCVIAFYVVNIIIASDIAKNFILKWLWIFLPNCPMNPRIIAGKALAFAHDLTIVACREPRNECERLLKGTLSWLSKKKPGTYLKLRRHLGLRIWHRRYPWNRSERANGFVSEMYDKRCRRKKSTPCILIYLASANVVASVHVIASATTFDVVHSLLMARV